MSPFFILMKSRDARRLATYGQNTKGVDMRGASACTPLFCGETCRFSAIQFCPDPNIHNASHYCPPDDPFHMTLSSSIARVLIIYLSHLSFSALSPIRHCSRGNCRPKKGPSSYSNVANCTLLCI